MNIDLKILVKSCLIASKILWRWLFIASLIALALFITLWTNDQHQLIHALIVSFLTGYFILICSIWKKVSTFIFALMSPVVSFFIMESWIDNLNLHPYSIVISGQSVYLNLIGYFIFAAIIYLLIGRWNWSSIVLICMTFIFGFINHLVYQARGRIITPQDFLAIPTAWRVMKSYSFTIETQHLIAAWIGVAILFSIGIALTSKNQRRPGLKVTLGLMSAIAIAIGSFFLTSLPDQLGLKDRLWDSMWTAKSSGALLDFMLNLRYSQIKKPAEYSENTVVEIMKQGATASSRFHPDDFFYSAESSYAVEQKPHLIVIMNESFSDLSVLGNVESSQNPISYFESLKQDSIQSGELVVPVLGGHTANTEFEFLTGLSCAFLPEQTVPYQLYIKDHSYSLPKYLSELGYTSLAVHPGSPESWNRQSVYTKMTFNYQYFEEDIQDPEYIRGYISDLTNYKNIIRYFEQHRKKGPLFIFNVTIQNHGGYKIPWNNLDKSVQLLNQGDESMDHVDQYLSLLQKSDDALRYLVEYFAATDEPVVVLFFGDHQPYLGDSFYNLVMSDPSSVVPPAQRVKLESKHHSSPSLQPYTVPFLIWTNDRTQKVANARITPNYLQVLLMRSAKIPMNGFQNFLDHLMQETPLVHSAHLDENYHSNTLLNYGYIQYYLLKYIA